MPQPGQFIPKARFKPQKVKPTSDGLIRQDKYNIIEHRRSITMPSVILYHFFCLTCLNLSKFFIFYYALTMNAIINTKEYRVSDIIRQIQLYLKYILPLEFSSSAFSALLLIKASFAFEAFDRAIIDKTTDTILGTRQQIILNKSTIIGPAVDMGAEVLWKEVFVCREMEDGIGSSA